MRYFLSLTLVFSLLFICSCSEQAADTGQGGQLADEKQVASDSGKTETGQEDQSYLTCKPEDIEWFNDDRFGMFIHWGPVSLAGTEISWTRKGPRRGMDLQDWKSIDLEVYDNLYKSFYPAQYDARQWAKIAKAAGMKYMVLTTKHHDGFCLFHSKYTDYDMESTPFKRDLVKEYADACRAEGLKVGFYYSQPDWRHEDYFTENHDKYIEYLHGQVRELMTNYGKVDIMWFDGLHGTAEDWDAYRLIKMIRRLQPGIIINNRCGVPGDFGTPEQHLGGFDREDNWESCITLCNQWAWRTNDKLKSLKKCIEMLVYTASGDGNLLLNVGPMPTGAIEPRQVVRLREIGEWLEKYGESYYGTRGGPYTPTEHLGTTCRGKNIYVHIMSWPEGEIELPPLPAIVEDFDVMTGGSATVKHNKKGLFINVPKESRDRLDTIIKLTINKKAEDIEPIRVLPQGIIKPVSASSSEHVSGYGPELAFDFDIDTRWATNYGVKQAWLEADLGKEYSVNRVKIDERGYIRIREFNLQVKAGGQWKTVYSAANPPRDESIYFEPVKTRYVRMNVLDALEGPTVWEMFIFGDK